MPIPSNRNSHRAFSLIEMVFAIGLVAVAGTLVVPLSKWSVTALRSAQQHTAMSRRFDLAISQLRADVWQAKNLKSSAPNSILLTLADGKKVTWKLGPADQVSRDDSHQAGWIDLGIARGSTLGVEGRTVRLIIAPSQGGEGKAISMISETAVLAGGTQ